MAKYYCEKYFYPEIYASYKCDHMSTHRCPRECYVPGWCSYKLDLNSEQFAILNSLRVVKEQNLKILKQNKKIIEELALQQLRKLK